MLSLKWRWTGQWPTCYCFCLDFATYCLNYYTYDRIVIANPSPKYSLCRGVTGTPQRYQYRIPISISCSHWYNGFIWDSCRLAMSVEGMMAVSTNAMRSVQWTTNLEQTFGREKLVEYLILITTKRLLSSSGSLSCKEVEYYTYFITRAYWQKSSKSVTNIKHILVTPPCYILFQLHVCSVA